MAIKSGESAPYAPAATFIEVVERYRDRGLTTPITTEVLERVGVPESLTSRTLQALRLLDFIDQEGNPSGELERLSRAPAKDWQEGLREMLAAGYSDVWSFADPATDGIDRVRDAFRAFNPRGQQERMVTLFLGLCEWAGMDVSAAKKKPSGLPPIPRRPKTNGGTPVARVERPTKGAIQRRLLKSTERGSSDPMATVSEELPPGLVGLLRQIPGGGRGWTKDKRDNFVAAFTAVLDFTVPIRPIGLEDLTKRDLVENAEYDQEHDS